jgi:hypothetical protein
MQGNNNVRRWALACLFSLSCAAAFCVGCTGYESHHSGPEDNFTFWLSGAAYFSLAAFVLALVGLLIVAARSDS